LSKTFCIQISGRVQGVGFRPFVYKLAHEFCLNGNVCNNESGVVITINATTDKAQEFQKAIQNKRPEASIITKLSIDELEQKDFDGFCITASTTKAKINIPLTPDFAICPSCKSDIEDESNRRFGYAFTTCVNCGPRYAVTCLFPFERANTSLSKFDMCSRCDEEYSTPKDKRFHSQTNTCQQCGITLELTNTHGTILSKDPTDIIRKVSDLILKGHIVALKNTNGYLLCCDAKNSKAIQELRKRKNRAFKPFAVLYPDIQEIRRDFKISKNEELELTSRTAPIVILSNTSQVSIENESIAPNLNQTGVMLPNSALLCLLMARLKTPIVATSGNTHGDPIISTRAVAQEKLSSIADFLLHNDLDIVFSQDDSVVKFVSEKKVILRRSRGLAPNIINQTKLQKEPVLALGADLKSAFTFSTGTQIYVSQYLGNLSNYDVLNRFKNTFQYYTTIFKTKPERLLIDKHLLYQSSQLGLELADEYDIPVEHIQHHKAHFASVLGEHKLFSSNEKILGVVWDGTGLGDDHQIWGGEFFVYEHQEIQRISHFNYFDWIANDKMAKEPRLSLLSLIDEELRAFISNKFTSTEWMVYSKTIQSNTLKTSSVGRLFDAVASLLDLCDYNTYEGEAAMVLEQSALQYNGNEAIDFLEEFEYDLIPTQAIIKQILIRIQNGEDVNKLAYSFIYTLARSITRMAQMLAMKKVACSGGVFQNSLLIKLLEQEPIDLILNKELSPNDENISFGQLHYYQNLKSEKHVFSNTRKNNAYRITA